MFGALRTLFTLAADLALAALGLAWSTLRTTVRVIGGGVDAGRAAWSMRGGSLHCPRGHVIETAGVFECACGFVYEGSAWFCPSTDCSAPISPFANCPDCGLSVRNPYRWGRPE